MLSAQAALDAGMIDKIGTMDAVVQRLAGRNVAPAVVQAEAVDHGAAAAEVLAARARVSML
jgi:ClpP class serine protease